MEDIIIGYRYAPITYTLYSFLSVKDLCLCLSCCREGLELKRQNSQIQWLIEKRKLHVYEYILSDGSKLTVPFFASIFEEACAKGYLDVVRYCLPFCKGVISLNHGIYSGLKSGQLQVVKFIYRDGSTLIGWHWLWKAISGRNSQCINWVIKKLGADIRGFQESYESQLEILSLLTENKSLYNQFLKLFQPDPNQRDQLIQESRLIYLSTKCDKESENEFNQLITTDYQERISMCCKTKICQRLFALGKESNNLFLFMNQIISREDEYSEAITRGVERSRSQQWLNKLKRIFPHLPLHNMEIREEYPNSIMGRNDIPMFIDWVENSKLSIGQCNPFGMEAALCSGRIWFFDYLKRGNIFDSYYAGPFNLDRYFLPLFWNLKSRQLDDDSSYYVFRLFLPLDCLAPFKFENYALFIIENLPNTILNSTFSQVISEGYAERYPLCLALILDRLLKSSDQEFDQRDEKIAILYDRIKK